MAQAQEAEPARIFQFNMCGYVAACGNNGSTDSGAVPAIVSSVIDFQPDIVTLNEVCRPQFRAILERLEREGRQMHGLFARTKDNDTRCGPGGDDDETGNALLSAMPLQSVTDSPFSPMPSCCADRPGCTSGTPSRASLT
jgi:hypothetical protein